MIWYAVESKDNRLRLLVLLGQRTPGVRWTRLAGGWWGGAIAASIRRRDDVSGNKMKGILVDDVRES